MTRQIVMGGDTARARRTDPNSSHVAADRSAQTRGQVHEAVVALIREHGPLNGRDLNVAYAEERFFAGWPMVAFDSPRKRAAELVGERLTIMNPEAIEHRGTPAIYGIAHAS